MVLPQQPRAALPRHLVIQYGQFNRNPGQRMQRKSQLNRKLRGDLLTDYVMKLPGDDVSPGS
jgi:hypothetical protein